MTAYCPMCKGTVAVSRDGKLVEHYPPSDPCERRKPGPRATVKTWEAYKRATTLCEGGGTASMRGAP